jgi:hypothetical protein
VHPHSGTGCYDVFPLRKFLAATSALLLLSMSAVPASAAADNSDAVSPLSAGNGLSEAAKQYLLRYPSRSGVDGKTAREDTAAVFIPFGATPEGDGRSWSGPTVPWAWLITARRR